VVEQFLEGEEASFFALIDGETCVALASAQDHKAVGEGDTGAHSHPVVSTLELVRCLALLRWHTAPAQDHKAVGEGDTGTRPSVFST